MKNNSKIFETIKRDFCVAIEECLNQFKENGYYKNTFEDHPGLFTTFSQILFDYMLNQLTEMNNATVFRNKHVDIDRTVMNNVGDEKLDIVLHEEIKYEQVCDCDDESNANKVLNVNNDDSPPTLTAAVIKQDEDDDRNNNVPYNIADDIDIDTVTVKMENPDFPTSNNQLVFSSLTDGVGDEMQVGGVKSENNENASINAESDLYKNEHMVEEAAILPVDDTQSIERRVTRRLKRKINYADDDDADENSLLSNDNLEIKKKRGNVQRTGKSITKRKSTQSADSYRSKKVAKLSRVCPNKLTSYKYNSNTKTSNAKKMRYIPIEMKEKVIKLAQEHPDWKLAKIRRHSGCISKIDKRRLNEWSNHVVSKGSLIDKVQSINKWVYTKYIESKNVEQNLLIENEKFKKWGLQAKEELFPYDEFEFIASLDWIIHFKKLYGIHMKPRIIISRQEKAKIVQLFDDNPTWSLKRLRKEIGRQFICKQDIDRFRLQLRDNSSMLVKINNWVFQKCSENKKKGGKITHELLTKLGHRAKEKLNYTKLNFCAGRKWLLNFKKKFNITGNPDDLQIMEQSYLLNPAK